MRMIAITLMISMGFLGLNRFTVVFDRIAVPTEQSCSMNCCSSGSCCGSDHEDTEDEAEKDLQCTSGCDCSFSIQIAATVVHFQSPIELELQAINYASYGDLYHCEYQPPHFQPPRMV